MATVIAPPYSDPKTIVKYCWGIPLPNKRELHYFGKEGDFVVGQQVGDVQLGQVIGKVVSSDGGGPWWSLREVKWEVRRNGKLIMGPYNGSLWCSLYKDPRDGLILVRRDGNRPDSPPNISIVPNQNKQEAGQ